MTYSCLLRETSPTPISRRVSCRRALPSRLREKCSEFLCCTSRWMCGQAPAGRSAPPFVGRQCKRTHTLTSIFRSDFARPLLPTCSYRPRLGRNRKV